MVNVPKHCWNLHHSIFIRFIDHCQVNWVGKRLSYRHAESLACLQKHCMSMKSILFLIETIERYQLRCNYFENKKIFLYCCISEIEMKFWTFWEKRWPLQILYFRNCRLRKRGQRNVWKIPFQNTLGQATWQTCTSTVQICTTASLSYSLITAK